MRTHSLTDLRGRQVGISRMAACSVVGIKVDVASSAERGSRDQMTATA